MPGIGGLIDQEKPLCLLADVLNSGNLPHAFLFTGAAGVGKSAVARLFFMSCNCRERRLGHTRQPEPVRPYEHKGLHPCGSCRPCRKILGGSHPDMHWVKPAGAAIKVDQIRDLCRKLALKSNEAEIRAAIITEAHTLNAEAGNTLLKVIEEPPARTIFLLTADSDSSLLPTIVSRCRRIRFNPISRACLQDHLEKQWGLTAPRAAVIAAMAQGSLARAKIMTQSDWMDERDQILCAVRGLSSGRVRQGLMFSEALSKNRDSLANALDIMKTWFRDIAVCRHAPDRVINLDLKDALHKAASEITMELLIHHLQAIYTAESDLQANANPRLTLDRLMIELAAGG